MIVCTRGASCLSLYWAEGRAVVLVLVGYNLESPYSIIESSFPSKPSRSVLDGLKSMPLCFMSFKQTMAQPFARCRSRPGREPLGSCIDKPPSVSRLVLEVFLFL